MIDFSGKIIWVKDSEEADCLLKMAISQGYFLPGRERVASSFRRPAPKTIRVGMK